MAVRNVKELVLAVLAQQPRVQAGEIAALAGVSRQAAHAHLRAMVEAGLLVREGAGRGARYGRFEPAGERTAPLAETAQALTFAPRGLAEDEVWREVEPQLDALAPLTANARTIFRYAFTELMNNAIEHAEATAIRVGTERTASGLAFEIDDDGVGAFQKIRRARDLPSEADAVFELSKGKLTTMPERHTGEGIFFTSKAADRFELEADKLRWVVDNIVGDIGLFAVPARSGTRARFEARPDKPETLESIFAEYTEDYEFTRTRALVKLLEYGSRLISRSEARRLCARLEEFSEVILDFAGVEGVGQGFVDEVFRVFARAHPEVKLIPTDMNHAVRFMVERGLRRADELR